jgi:hypothetical protein
VPVGEADAARLRLGSRDVVEAEIESILVLVRGYRQLEPNEVNRQLAGRTSTRHGGSQARHRWLPPTSTCRRSFMARDVIPSVVGVCPNLGFAGATCQVMQI